MSTSLPTLAVSCAKPFSSIYEYICTFYVGKDLDTVGLFKVKSCKTKFFQIILSSGVKKSRDHQETGERWNGCSESCKVGIYTKFAGLQSGFARQSDLPHLCPHRYSGGADARLPRGCFGPDESENRQVRGELGHYFLFMDRKISPVFFLLTTICLSVILSFFLLLPFQKVFII